MSDETNIDGAGTQKKDDIPEILFIDDDAEYRGPVVSYLADKGYKVVEIDSGPSVNRVLESKPWSWIPAAIVVDLVLPGTSGYDVIRRFNERYKSRNVPIIVVSRLSTKDDIVESELAGANCFVVKPHAPEAIINCLEYCKRNFSLPVEDQKKTIEIFRPA